ncbi:terminase small subunit [Pseudomonas guariconensis]|uniref:terminase small subunit n=1 Tax=Pseudomonas TaxID=286 RepID=UPI0020984C84|nr:MULTISPECIES: terminase small subunit [Pseudomonas]MCO7513725.1 terminase small subunit [Pseudomonas putida]MCO7603874.1 terminase small subunit [Pseudomonas guariconensis]
MALTAKQQRFVVEYLVDLNATQAAIRAGYAPARAREQAYQLMKKPEVKAAIEKAMAERSKRLKVDADYVLQRLVEIDQLDVIDILNDDLTLLPLSEWPKAWRLSLSGMDITEIGRATEDASAAMAFLKKIKWPDKVRNLELLGKHVNVNAFKEQVDVTVTGLSARMAKAKERVRDRSSRG